MKSFDQFVARLAVVLECDPAELGDDSVLEWESLLVLSTLTLLSQDFGLTPEVECLIQCKTLGELRRLIYAQAKAA
jgi:acyl carrier protein